MTTKHSPERVIRAQASGIAAIIKAAERGDKIDVKFAKAIEEARTKETFKVGVVMDDKVIKVDLPWATIRETSEKGLTEFIVGLMLETRNTVN